MLMRKFAFFYALLAFTILTGFNGCTAVKAPENPEQAVAYGYATLATVRNTAAGMLSQRQITVEQAENVQKMADQARFTLDMSKSLARAGKPTDAQAAVSMANTVLQSLQGYLTTLQAKKP